MVNNIAHALPAIEVNIPKYNVRELRRNLVYKRSYFVAKRVLDISVSGFLLAALSPLFLIVSLLIRLSSPGKSIFKQKRVGLGGKEFTMFKFRSMHNHINLNGYAKLLEDTQSKGILLKNESDPRIFWFGKFIRKTSIDELPQLINVFIGNMTLVGPRPLVPFMLEPYPEEKRVRSLVKPGITGLWQVEARQFNLSVLQMINWDIEYVKTCSLKNDLKIIFKTPFVVFKGKGAY